MFYSGFILYAVWLSSPALQVFLLLSAMRRKLFHTCPIFFWYLIFGLIKTAILCPTWRYAGIYYHSHWIGKTLWKAYFVIYWSGEFVSTLLFIAILYQLYSYLFQGYGGFTALQDKLFRWSAGTSLAVSAIIAMMVPANDPSRLMAAMLTFDLTAAIVKAGMVFFVLIASSILSLRWSYYAFGILAGAGLFATVDAASVAARLISGETAHAQWALIKSAAYACTMLVWVVFYAREPKTASANIVPNNDLAAWNQALVEMLTR